MTEVIYLKGEFIKNLMEPYIVLCLILYNADKRNGVFVLPFFWFVSYNSCFGKYPKLLSLSLVLGKNVNVEMSYSVSLFCLWWIISILLSVIFNHFQTEKGSHFLSWRSSPLYDSIYPTCSQETLTWVQ